MQNFVSFTKSSDRAGEKYVIDSGESNADVGIEAESAQRNDKIIVSKRYRRKRTRPMCIVHYIFPFEWDVTTRLLHGTSIEEEKEDARVHECTRVQTGMQLVSRKERVFACAKVSALRITKGFNEYLEYSTLVWHKIAFVSETTWRICRYHQTSKEV